MLLQNKVNINDWSSVQSLFDKLNKQLEKTQKVTDALGVPRVYVRILVELEDNLKKTLADKDAKKKMSPTNAKALNTMRQRLKKHNVAFQEQIDKFRENPESTEEEPSDDSELDSDSDEGSDEEEQEDADVDGFEKVLPQFHIHAEYLHSSEADNSPFASNESILVYLAGKEGGTIRNTVRAIAAEHLYSHRKYTALRSSLISYAS